MMTVVPPQAGTQWRYGDGDVNDAGFPRSWE